MRISTRYEKNNQVPMLNPDRQISVSGDTMSHPSLGYRLDWYLWHRITLDWDLSVWVQHWYLILLFLSYMYIFLCLCWQGQAFCGPRNMSMARVFWPLGFFIFKKDWNGEWKVGQYVPFGCPIFYTGKPVLTDTRDRRTLVHNGQILIERNFSFIKSLK